MRQTQISLPEKPRERPAHLFQPGRSGNPGGKPKALQHVQELARSYTKEAIMALAEALDDPKTKVAAASVLLDRGWGKAVQPLSDVDGAGLQIVIRRMDAEDGK